MKTVRQELIDYLGNHLTGNKRDKIRAALGERTRHLTVLLEDLNQPHNASACLRSCDCFGVQDVHVIERRHPFQPDNDVAMGSNKWLSIHRYHQPESALETLRARGAIVDFVCVYERKLCDPTAEELGNVAKACREGGIHYLLAMSVASLEALLDLLPAECRELLASARLVTPSDRVIIAAKNRLPGIRGLLASGPGASDMVAAMIADWRQQADEMND